MSAYPVMQHAPSGHPGKDTFVHLRLQAALWGALLIGLFLLSRHNFLLFHGVAELFSIAVAWSVFLLVWNTRPFLRNDALLFLGVAYFFVGLLDLVHTLAYKGMGVFPASAGANLATQLWIAGRGLEALSLLAYALLVGKPIRFRPIFASYCAVTALLLTAILVWDAFPVCFVEGSGLTPFKIAVEYAICLVLATAIGVLASKRDALEPDVFRLIVASMALTIAGELAFTFYVSVYGLSNLVGHFFKILSFYFVYLALVRSSLTRPYRSLFRQLELERERLSRSDLLHQARLSLLEHAGDLSAEGLMTFAIDEVERLTDSRIGFFHTLDEDGQTLTLQAWSTRTLAELCSMPGKGLHYGVDQAGVWADCVRLRHGIIHNEYMELTNRRGFPQGHAPVARELVVPVFRAGRIVAILGIGNKPTP